MGQTKSCNKCGTTKPKDLFPKCGVVCKACQAVYGRVYYQANKERLTENARQYYRAHRGRRKETSKAWKENHPEKVKQYRKRYRQRNVEREPTPAAASQTGTSNGKATQEGQQIQFVGTHPSILKLMELVQVVSKSNAFVFIQGESGTGKEILARLIHQMSGRDDDPFVALNCASLPCELAEEALPATIQTIAEMEHYMIRQALVESNNNQQTAAKRLGISSRTIRNKLRKYREEGLIL